MPSSTAVRTPLHAALSVFHVAGVPLLISRRASRRLARGSSTAALVYGVSHHSVGSTVCAASRIASVNSLAASGAVVFGWPVRSPRLCRNLSTMCRRDISTCNYCRLNCRYFGLARTARLGDSATEVDSGYCHVVVRVHFSRECGLAVYNHVAYSASMCLPREYVVDAFEVARAVRCDIVVCVRTPPIRVLKKVFMMASLL